MVLMTRPQQDIVNTQNSLDSPYMLASKKIKQTKTVIKLDYGISIGGEKICIIAGPCAIESVLQIEQTAQITKQGGAHILRGGAYKPRTSPYSFQGLGCKALKMLHTAGCMYEMPIITEVMDPDQIRSVTKYADIIQVGARNCQNFALLKKLGKIDKPVLLKRGMMNTIEELLFAAEYIMAGGNHQVILCERGIRTFETKTRNTLDISAIPILKRMTHLPVIVDPSHAAGTWQLIEPLTLAAIAAGADGIMIEVHHKPEEALSDGEQSLRPDKYRELMYKIRKIVPLFNRTV
jgi:3-deoxy-7-phosphoheptulonate synthase